MANGYKGLKISPKHSSHEQSYRAKSISHQSQGPKTIDNIVNEISSMKLALLNGKMEMKKTGTLHVDHDKESQQ